MSATGEAEVEAAGAEQPVMEEAPAATEEKEQEETGEEKEQEETGEEKEQEETGGEKQSKAAKGKKGAKEKKAPKEKKPKGEKGSHPSHPPYFQMIKDAIMTLKEKNGSSAEAIAKHVEEKHKGVLPANFKKILWLQLKNFTAKGKLIKIKASFKLADQGKKTGAAKIGAGKPSTRASKNSNKPKNSTTPAKKVRSKKSTPAKPKQPKSIKSPAVKRTKKATG